MGITLNVNFEAMKEQIKQAIIDSSVEGHIDLEELTNNLLNLHSVVGILHISNQEINDQSYNSLNKIEHLTEQHRQGYFHGYKNGCYWMRKKYSK